MKATKQHAVDGKTQAEDLYILKGKNNDKVIIIQGIAFLLL
ncbi:MAG: hypothetical protein Q3983_00795 [Capnocytophaga sp.]|nr:hypothetical protein [Capnocytophaga sp.]